MSSGNSSIYCWKALLDFSCRNQMRAYTFSCPRTVFYLTFLQWDIKSCSYILTSFCWHLLLKSLTEEGCIFGLARRASDFFCFDLTFQSLKMPRRRAPAEGLLTASSVLWARTVSCLNIAESTAGPREASGSQTFPWTQAKERITFPHERELYWDDFSSWAILIQELFSKAQGGSDAKMVYNYLNSVTAGWELLLFS